MHISTLLEASSRITGTLQLYVPNPKNVNEMFKPEPDANTIWTSTASRVGDKYTSEWVEWCKYEMPHWLSNMGFLYRVSPAARVLNMDSDAAAYEIAKKYGIEPPEDRFDFSWIRKFPWNKIRTEYDAIHHIPTDTGMRNIFMSSWDVESTVWFNKTKLIKIAEVPISKEKPW